MTIERSLFACVFGCCLALGLLASPTEAQFLGHNFTGDMGLMSGTQGRPGWNVAAMYLRYDGETLRGPDSVDVFLGPKAPEGKEKNWIKTDPSKGFFVVFRFYGPLEGYIDKTWTLGDFELIE